jgi:hypothetical protein
VEIFDDLTLKINKLLEEKHEAIIQELIPIIHTDESPIDLKERPPRSELIKYYRKKSDAVLPMIKSICEKYPYDHFLITTRKISSKPSKKLSKFLPLLTQDGCEGIYFENSINIATNCILKFSSHDFKIRIKQEDLILDSFRFLILCYMRCLLNGLCVGARVYEKKDVDQLIKNINENKTRSFEYNNDLFFLKVGEITIIYIDTASFFQPRDTMPVFHSSDNFQCNYVMNYLPIFNSARSYREEFNWLSNLNFQQFYGISYKRFFTCFILVNMFIADRIAPYDPDKPIAIENEFDEQRFAIIRQLRHMGLICTNRNELINYCIQSKYAPADFTSNDISVFIDKVTMNSIDTDKISIDNYDVPFIFYRLENDNLIWDICRHNRLFHAISKKIVQDGEFGNIKGKAYEDNVLSFLKAADLEGIEDLQQNVIIYSDDGRKLMDIDIGFVFKQVLYLLEIKSYAKKDGELSGHFYKGHRLIQYLRRYDMLLKKHQDKIYKQWDQNKFTSVTNFLISSELETNIPFDYDLWYIMGEIPRICTIGEFFWYLKRISSNT